MYERFSDRAQRVMVLAQQEAQRWDHQYVGTEHILLGLIREGGGLAAGILQRLGVGLAAVQLKVETLMASGPEVIITGKLPQTPAAKRAIEFALEESRTRDNTWVGTEHLFIGLVREPAGLAQVALANLGITLDRVRAALDSLLPRGLIGTGAPKEPAFHAVLADLARAYNPADHGLSIQSVGAGIYRVALPENFDGWFALGDRLTFLAGHGRIASLLVFMEERETEEKK